MAKNRFVTNKTTRIELSDGDWMDLRDDVSVEQQMELELLADNGKSPQKAAIPFLTMVLIDWSFVDQDGNKIPCTVENIKRLNLETFAEITPKIQEWKEQQKKNLTINSQQLPLTSSETQDTVNAEAK